MKVTDSIIHHPTVLLKRPTASDAGLPVNPGSALLFPSIFKLCLLVPQIDEREPESTRLD